MDDVILDFVHEYDTASDVFTNVVLTEPRCRLKLIRSSIEHNLPLLVSNDLNLSRSLTLLDDALFEGIKYSRESKLLELIAFGADVNSYNMVWLCANISKCEEISYSKHRKEIRLSWKHA
jgi:hypothetical protein